MSGVCGHLNGGPLQVTRAVDAHRAEMAEGGDENRRDGNAEHTGQAAGDECKLALCLGRPETRAEPAGGVEKSDLTDHALEAVGHAGCIGAARVERSTVAGAAGALPPHAVGEGTSDERTE